MIAFRAATRDDRSLALVLALAAASGAALLPFVPRFTGLAPGCVFHALTGVPCPGCGTTRAVLALARGDVPAALAWNPLAAATLLVGGAACVLAPLWLALRGPVPVFPRQLPVPARVALVLAIAANWAWLITTRV